MTDYPIVQTDFCYSAEELPDLEAFLDSLEVNYEVFEDDDDCFKAVLTNIDSLTMLKIAEWEMNYAGSL
jgi:hypothetical protein